MKLSQIQTLVLWATLSLVLIEITYPPTVTLLWHDAPAYRKYDGRIWKFRTEASAAQYDRAVEAYRRSQRTESPEDAQKYTRQPLSQDELDEYLREAGEKPKGLPENPKLSQWKRVLPQEMAELGKHYVSLKHLSTGRTFVLALSQWIDWEDSDRADFKQSMDVWRVVVEGAIAVLIGAGLACVLVPRRE